MGDATDNGTKAPSAASHYPAKGRQALDDLYSATYREMLRMAASIKRADPKATISTATLVHETWMKLARAESLAPESRLHMRHIVARAMRQFVIEAARRRSASKRGGAAGIFVTLDDSLEVPVSRDRDLLALDLALEELAQMNQRQATVVEIRYFGGFDIPETAALLGISEKTVDRDWRAAKAWLAAQVRMGRAGG